MSNAATYFRAMAHNNAWSNFRLLSACAKLSDADFQATRVSFFPSIVCSKNQKLKNTSARVTAIISRYWLSR